MILTSFVNFYRVWQYWVNLTDFGDFNRILGDFDDLTPTFNIFIFSKFFGKFENFGIFLKILEKMNILENLKILEIF